MKKIMIAVCAVAFSAVAQAAAFDWGFSSDSIVDPAGDWISGGTASLYIDSVLVATAGQNEDYTYGSFDLSANDSSGKVRTLSTGTISSTFEGQAYQLILTYNDGTDDWTYTYNGTSYYRAVTGAPGEDATNYETFTTSYAIQSSDWVKAGPAPTPEPTSGLLLLLGMAGLALRRRRA